MQNQTSRMKNILYALFLFCFLKNTSAQQRTIAEATINFNIYADSSLGKNASKTVYIKGNDARVDVLSSSFNQTTIYDKVTGNAVVLREIGSNKIMSKLTKSQWIEKNKKFDSLNIDFQADSKIILGYDCKKAVISTKDGTSIFTVYFATNISPSVKEFEWQFKDLPGLVLEYEVTENNKTIKYVAAKLSLSPVQPSKFDLPTSGYRVLN